MIGSYLGLLARLLRERWGWNQEMVAERASLGVASIRRFEAGRNANQATIDAIAKALDVSVATLHHKAERLRQVLEEEADGRAAAPAAAENDQELAWLLLWRDLPSWAKPVAMRQVSALTGESDGVRPPSGQRGQKATG